MLQKILGPVITSAIKSNERNFFQKLSTPVDLQSTFTPLSEIDMEKSVDKHKNNGVTPRKILFIGSNDPKNLPDFFFFQKLMNKNKQLFGCFLRCWFFH